MLTHDVAGFGQRAMEEHRAALPVIGDGLSGRLAVDVDDDRIASRGSKMRRLEHPAVEHDAVADVDREELDRAGEHRRERRRAAPPCR